MVVMRLATSASTAASFLGVVFTEIDLVQQTPFNSISKKINKRNNARRESINLSLRYSVNFLPETLRTPVQGQALG
jgi:hypothetical protein